MVKMEGFKRAGEGGMARGIFSQRIGQKKRKKEGVWRVLKKKRAGEFLFPQRDGQNGGF